MATQEKTQTEQVIDYLEKSHGPVSARELFIQLDINSPRKIITNVKRRLSDRKLRKDTRPNGKNKPYKVYWIEET